jgi:hypothetical protein
MEAGGRTTTGISATSLAMSLAASPGSSLTQF